VDRREFIAAAGSVTAVASTPQAFAETMGAAILAHAVPGVGLTVSGSPREIRLHFTIGVLAASSSMQVTSATGGVILVSKPDNDPSDQHIVIVRLGRVLPPGTYRVRRYVVSLGITPLPE
jgi:copper resistance protein C